MKENVHFTIETFTNNLDVIQWNDGRRDSPKRFIPMTRNTTKTGRFSLWLSLKAEISFREWIFPFEETAVVLGRQPSSTNIDI
ncbi:hypothetical protein AB6A40_001749 [Gnathostoma spinigerum]|uniref:Uncharacterized protein n=1 Tax=Gnathostoma spinigerum TaxID=75299 RepID=A0ABD6E5X0_9BILA